MTLATITVKLKV